MPTLLSLTCQDRTSHIHIGYQCLSDMGEPIQALVKGKTLVLITQAIVDASYGETVRKACQNVGYTVHTVMVPDGELAKSLDQVALIIDQLVGFRLERQDAILALGGGVVGDLAGFVAAIYLRGIACIQIPTTVLAQVDAAIGGKTGVNHPNGKNLIGAFHQPLLTYCDLATLTTLSARHRRSGLAEVVKYGMIRDREFFDYIVTHQAELNQPIVSETLPVWQQSMERSCQHKIDIVAQDEKEAGLRAILNFGHTIGHAIETVGHYQTYWHGEAVALGMLAETRLAIRLGRCDESVYTALWTLLMGLGFTCQCQSMAIDALIAAMRLDKKVVQGVWQFVLPTAIGSVEIVSQIETDAVLWVLHDMQVKQ